MRTSYRLYLATLGVALALLLPAALLVGATGSATAAARPIPWGATLRSLAASPGPAPELRAASLAPSGVPTWTNVTRTAAGSSPPAGYGSSVAYDAAAHATILFGGCLADQCPSNQTWSFANGTWTQIAQRSAAPPARQSAAMDFDARLGGLLLFGGDGNNGPLNDTWLFQGGRWSNVSYVGGGPSPRYGAMMAYDPAPEENGSVLYGGCIAAGFGVSCYNDTWVWQGWAGWVPLAVSAPPPALGFGAFAYDPALGSILLYGGCSGTFCLGVSNQTWLLYSGQWWPLHPSVFPSPRTGAGLIFDPGLGTLLLFGGLNASFVLLGDSWTYGPTGWQLFTPANTPSPRYDFGMALDPTGTVPLLVGGSALTGSQNDTWAYEVPPSISVSASPSPQEAGAPVRIAVTVAGGSGHYGVAVSYGSGAGGWASGTGPTFTVTASYAVPGVYLPGANLTDSAGETVGGLAAPVRVVLGPSVSATVDRSQVDAGVPVHFGANASGSGSPPYSLAWSFGDGATATGSAVAHTYATPGTYGVLASLTDAAGGSASARLTITVAAWPTASIVLGPGAPNTSAPVALSPSLTGGTGPVHYAWSFGDGASSALPSPDHRFASAGTYTVQLWANDSGGGSAHATQTITVAVGTGPSGPSASTNPASGAPVWFWPGIGAIAIIALVGSILLARRHRST
jgi:PKD repeat protein